MLESLLLPVWILFDEDIEKSAETNAGDAEDVSAGNDNMTQNSPDKVNKILEAISKGSATKQLLVGAASGWVTGFLTVKVGKSACFAVGGGILIYQVAHIQGLKFNMKPLKDQAEKLTQNQPALKNTSGYLQEVRKFARPQTPFSAGFLGGFLLGISM